MKRNFVLFSSILVLTATTLAASANAAPASEKLGRQQVKTLIAAAHTPAEHSHIAQYYLAQSEATLAQARVHEKMAAEFAKNPAAISAKFATGTVDHCQYLAQHLKAEAARYLELAQAHEAMAREASGK